MLANLERQAVVGRTEDQVRLVVESNLPGKVKEALIRVIQDIDAELTFLDEVRVWAGDQFNEAWFRAGRTGHA